MLELDRLVQRAGGAAPRALLLRHGVPRHVLDNAVRRGNLVAIAPATYCRPWDADDIKIRERGAVMSVGGPGALSHVSALRRWDLLPDHRFPVHVAVARRRGLRGSPDLVVHRAEHFPPVVRLDGLLTVDAAEALVWSWPLLRGPDQRGPAIRAVRRRLVGPAHLGEAVARHPRLTGRAALTDLVGLLEAGCESELEIWGHRHVFDHPGLRHARRQHVVRTRRGVYRIDHAYERERVAVEMDGASFHSSAEQRERDMRRDAALAALGWLTLRFSHPRLHLDVAGCRSDTLAALACRTGRG